MLAANERNIAIVCNPLAGSGNSEVIAKKIAEALSEKNISHRLFDAEWPEHFDPFSIVFIVGGDGTLNYFINHYPEIKQPLAIFKGGSGNDFHWLLYGTITLSEQLELVLKGILKPVDVGRCNGLYFINGLGIGFEGAVVKSMIGKKKRPGKISFMLTILKKIFGYKSREYEVSSAEKKVAGKKLLVDVVNGRRAGGGFHIAPTSRIDDGLLDVILVDDLHPWKRLVYLPVMERGKHLKLPFIQHYQSTQIKIQCTEAVSFHMDGEYGEAATFEIELLPAQLYFIY